MPGGGPCAPCKPSASYPWLKSKVVPLPSPNCLTRAMATPSGSRRLSSHDHLAGNRGFPLNGRRRPDDSEVIDLTSPPTASATATIQGIGPGIALSDFIIGDRLGATRDGREEFQVQRLVGHNAGCALDVMYVRTNKMDTYGFNLRKITHPILAPLGRC